ncbi:hypothetical protein ABZ419_00225 [Streptomyces cinnamoneus]|uniref:hypothetical protein n=1 Tax=Streptomyces cinnamoneus TaxID=53446 RepID=UPI0033D041DB
MSEPRRAPGQDRWCEQVALTFTNTGGTPVTGGTVSLGTHIIGVFGTDWATVTSTHPLPAPIAPGQSADGTWTVCVDAWRVPLGMRIETRDVTVDPARPPAE